MGGAANRPIAPMLATLGAPPLGADERWAAEFKWDGCRIVASTCGDAPVLWSRSGSSVGQSYPEVVEALDSAVGSRQAILDGELVVLDTEGRPSFGLLQARMNVTKPTTALRRRVAVTFYAFDLLSLGGVDLTAAPYLDRRAALADLDLAGPRLKVPPHWVGIDSETMLDVARQHSLEGVVFKKVASIYLPGTRSKSWIKTVLRRRASALILGWVASGAQRNVVGSLILGVYDDAGELVPIGQVGTGLSAVMRRRLRDLLAPLARTTSPLAASSPYVADPWIRWTEAEVVVDVDFREFTGGGLRHPSFKGIREDVPPRDVRRSSLQ